MARRRACYSLTDDLRELARFVLLRDFIKRKRLDLASLAFAAELRITVDTDLHRRFARGLQVIARIELARVGRHVAANRAGNGQTQVGVDVDLAYAIADTFLDFLDRHAVSFLHVAAEFADLSQQFLRYRRRT